MLDPLMRKLEPLPAWASEVKNSDDDVPVVRYGYARSARECVDPVTSKHWNVVRRDSYTSSATRQNPLAAMCARRVVLRIHRSIGMPSPEASLVMPGINMRVPLSDALTRMAVYH
jgi:hypothetical protein